MDYISSHNKLSINRVFVMKTIGLFLAILGSMLSLKSQDLGYVEFAINAKYSTSFVFEDRNFSPGKEDFKTFPSPNSQFILNSNSEFATIYDLVHKDTVFSLQFSGSNPMINYVWNHMGTTLYCVHKDGKISVLDAAAKEVKAAFKPLVKKEDIRSVALSPDGIQLALGSNKGVIYIVNLKTKMVTNIFEEHTRSVLSLDWSIDGQDIVSSSDDKKIHVYNIAGSKLKAELKSPSRKPITYLKYGNNGELITVVDECGRVFNLDAKSLAIMQKQEFAIDCSSEKTSFVSEQDKYVFVGFEQNILVYKRATLEPLTIIKGLEFDVANIKVNAEQNKVFAIDESGLVYVSRIGPGASIIEDLNSWLSTSPLKSIASLSESPAIKRLFVTDDFSSWVEKNPLLQPLLKARSQFETESEYNSRFSLGVELLIDQLVMTSENDLRMNDLFEYLNRMEVANSRKPLTLYPRDFTLEEYDIASGMYTITVLRDQKYQFKVNRDRAKSLHDNKSRCVIECIEQKDIGSNGKELINLKLIHRDLGQTYKLSEEVDLLNITDKSLLPPELKVSDIVIKQGEGVQTLTFDLANISDGSTRELIIEIEGPFSKYRARYKINEIQGKERKRISIENSETLKSLDWNDAYINILERGGYQLSHIPINSSLEVELDQKEVQLVENDLRRMGDFEFSESLNLNGIVWNTDGRYFLVNTGANIQVWDAISRQAIRSINIPVNSSMSSTNWGSNELSIICVDTKGNCIVYDLDSGDEISTTDLGIPNQVLEVFIRGDNTLYAIDNYGFLYHINYTTGNQLDLKRLSEEGVQHSFISPNASQIAIVNDANLSLFNLKTGREYWSLEHDGCYQDVSWNPSGNLMLLSGCDSSVKIIESLNGKSVRTLKDRTEGFLAAKWSDFGDYIVTLSQEEEMTLWYGNTGVPFERYTALDSGTHNIIINPEGTSIISSSEKDISLWSPGEFIEVLESVSDNGSTLFEELALKDSILQNHKIEYDLRSEANQFETQTEFTSRLKSDNLNFAKKILRAQSRMEQREILEELRIKEAVKNSRRLTYKDMSTVELGRYNMYTEIYPLKYNGEWFDIPLNRDEARQLYKYSQIAKIRLIAQLDSTLSDTVFINPSLIHSNGKEFAIGDHIDIEGGTFSNVLPPKLVLNSIKFIDNDGDQILSAGESARLKLEIENQGEGDASFLRILSNSNIPSYDGMNAVIDNIKKGQTMDFYLELASDNYLMDSVANLSLSFVEANGFGMDTIALSFQTRAFKAPNLKLSDFAISDNDGRPIISTGELIDITIRFRNYGEGPANDVGIRLTAGDDVFIVGASDNSLTAELGPIKPGQVKDYQFQAFCNNEAKSFSLDYSIRDNSSNPYSAARDLGLSINKEAKGIKQLIFEEESLAVNADDNFTNELLDGIPEARDTNDNAILVIIGNKNYRGNMPPVEYALNDAYTIQEYFKAYLGVKPGNIILKEDATLSDMKVLFGDKNDPDGRLKDLVKPGITDLYVYYSGHGAPDLNSSKGYLMPTDANPSRLSLTAFAMDDLIENLAYLETRQSTLIVDACFSGGVSTGDYLVKNASSLGLKVKSVSNEIPNNIAVMTASADDQVASWYSDKKHGLFTYFLLKGMSGDANLDGDSKITLEELNLYISDVDNGVPYKARELYSREQTPRFIGNNSFSISIQNK
mgnify:CR=1 FL=1